MEGNLSKWTTMFREWNYLCSGTETSMLAEPGLLEDTNMLQHSSMLEDSSMLDDSSALEDSSVLMDSDVNNSTVNTTGGGDHADVSKMEPSLWIRKYLFRILSDMLNICKIGRKKSLHFNRSSILSSDLSVNNKVLTLRYRYKTVFVTVTISELDPCPDPNPNEYYESGQKFRILVDALLEDEYR